MRRLPPAVAPDASSTTLSVGLSRLPITTLSPSTSMLPPAPLLPVADTDPATRVVPVADSIVMAPPVLPLAMVLLPAASSISPLALSTISPAASNTSALARISPVCFSVPANILTDPPSAISLPMLSALSTGAWTSKLMPS